MAGYRVTKMLDDKEQRFDFREGPETSDPVGGGGRDLSSWSMELFTFTIECRG